MSSCMSCGISIPENQQTCSLCYGDIDHGSDGYYRAEVELQMQEEMEREMEYMEQPNDR